MSVQPSVDAEDNNGDHATLESESVSNDVTTDGMVEGEPESSGRLSQSVIQLFSTHWRTIISTKQLCCHTNQKEVE